MPEDTNDMIENEEVVENNEQEVQQTTDQMPVIEPVVFDKPQFDAFVERFKDAPGGSSNIIAKTLAGEVQTDMPDIFSYESLKDGTAKLFDFTEGLKDLQPNQRRLSDDEIINLLAVDTEGNPIEAGTFLEGFQREIAPSVGSAGAFYYGAKLGSSVPAPPPVKLGVGTVTGIISSLFGYTGGQELTELVLGPEKPLLPSQRAAYEMGKTSASVIGWLPMPFAVSKNVNLGVADYLKNLAITDIKQAPRSVRLTRGVEKMLGRMGKTAKEHPLETLALEGIVGVGQTAGAGYAESSDPGAMGTRLAWETLGGVGFNVIGNPITTMLANAGDVKNIFSNIRQKYREGGIKNVLSPIKNRRQVQAVDRIMEILEAEEKRTADQLNIRTNAIEEAKKNGVVDVDELTRIGDEAENEFIKGNIDNIITRLAGDDISNLLLDESGKPIKLTAGAKSGNPALLAIEASLEQLGSSLGSERQAGSQAAIKALRNLINAMALTGDQQALQQAADLAETVFTANLTNKLKNATDQVLKSYEKIKPDVESNIQLSETLYDVIKQQMKLGRDKERKLWNSVPNVKISSFFDSEGNLTSTPKFIAKWNQLFKDSPTEYKNEFVKAMNPINNFIKRKSFELGLDEKQPEKIIPLTVKDLTDMRSLALEYARSFTAKGESNKARLAHEMADSLLEDLEGVVNNSALRQDELFGSYLNVLEEMDPEFEQGFVMAYNTARAYSRGFNETFKRAFTGDAMNAAKEGTTSAPELLAKRLITGGSDPTYLRVQQINDIGKFGVKEGLEGAEQTTGTLLSVTEQIVRNARVAAFDPETGAINPKQLQKWVDSNSDILDLFPALKNDLMDAKKANILLDETSKVSQRRKNELMAQASFYDLMNPVLDDSGRRLLGTESPTTAIAKAINSKAPVRSLNEYLKIIKNADIDDVAKDQAMSGLKSSILEWASTKAGLSHSGTFSPRVLYEAMFTPMKGSKNRIGLMEWMLDNKVINEAESSNLKTYLTEMVRFEAAEQAGELGELVEKVGPILDFYLGITGSAIGTKVQKTMMGGESGPGALIAAGRGAQTMRELFQNIPQALQTDVMSELMRNPELLAAMMRKPRSAKEKMRLGKRVKQIFLDLGFRPVDQIAPSVIRETVEETQKYEIPEEVDTNVAPAQVIPNQSSLPTPPTVPTQASVGAAPSMNLVGSAAPATPTTNSGPVDRTRYAAIFPGDTASQMIRSGIGSLGAV